MTWNKLFSSQPELAKAAEYFSRSFSQLFPAMEQSVQDLYPGDQPVDWSRIDHLVTWQMLGRLWSTIQSRASVELAWSYVAQTQLGQDRFLFFKSSGGGLARLPAPFVDALLRNEVLTVDLVTSPQDPTVLLLQRSGQTEGEIPLGLLDHLLQRRDSERGRELVQPPRQSLALNRPKGGPAFRSAERSTEREPQPSSQTEQELEVKETGR